MQRREWEFYQSYDVMLDEIIRLRHGDPAFEAYVHHPSQRFPHLFNRVTQKVDGRGIGPVYVNLRRFIVRGVHAGKITDGRHLHRVAVVALKWLVLHHEALTWRRDHPMVPPMEGDPDNAARPPLFAGGVDVAAVAETVVGPPDEVIGRESLARVLRAARGIGLLHVRAVQIYWRAVFAAGKAHGAYVHVARYAVLRDGKVVKFRPWRAEIDPAVAPDGRVVRQVRAIVRAARDRVSEAARRLGFEPPPGP